MVKDDDNLSGSRPAMVTCGLTDDGPSLECRIVAIDQQSLSYQICVLIYDSVDVTDALRPS
jgi:hypothetical protein